MVEKLANVGEATSPVCVNCPAHILNVQGHYCDTSRFVTDSTKIKKRPVLCPHPNFSIPTKVDEVRSLVKKQFGNSTKY